ncbi:Transmembrane proteins 14C [Candidatus Rubidus massiliensis]|nr:MAG: hypothetical protein BGO10_00140 [Chlamydia sp. 32-24]CDZ80625.1 Transmembrane proteins 14C [Candidatus Rubidus massiliensis]
MNFKGLLTILYGLLVLIGGIIGHLKANSMPSLIAGSVFGVILILIGISILKNINYAKECAIGISYFLLLFFIYRFSLSLKFMPAGFMTLVSLCVALLLTFRKDKTTSTL